MVTVFLVYPAIKTIIDSFRDDRGTGFVGFDNYVDLAKDNSLRSTLLNNVLWVLIGPFFCVLFGLAVAVLADRLSKRWEVDRQVDHLHADGDQRRRREQRSGCSSTSGGPRAEIRSVCSTRSGPASAASR